MNIFSRHIAHVLADVMIGVAAVRVIPEEVPRPGEQRVVVLPHHEAVLQIDKIG